LIERQEQALSYQEIAMRCRHLIVVAVVMFVGLVALYGIAPLLPAQQAGGFAAPKRCIGITSSVLRAQNPVITRVYRVFDDGSVETYDDGAPGAKWTQLGK
jgi:hypothetical protein